MVNCRCTISQRAKWRLDEKELTRFKERAEYYGIDKTENFIDYKSKYLKIKGLGATDNFDMVPEHNPFEIIDNIDFEDDEAVKVIFENFEKQAVKEKIETACVIAKDGTVYKCYGVETRVFPDYDLGDKLIGAKVSHNHPIDYTEYSFSKDDYQLFMNYKLEVLRGCDEKYTYEFTRNADEIDGHLPMFEITDEDGTHEASIINAEKGHIGYRRWLR